jgi:hypothetical protein
MAVLLRGGGGGGNLILWIPRVNLEWLGRYVGNLCDVMKATLHGEERGCSLYSLL